MPNDKVRAFFENLHALRLMVTFGDVRLDAQESEITANDPRMSLETRLSRRVSLKIPIVSSPMDRVTEARMAIAMAEVGGLGIIHRGLSPKEQAKEIARVKNRRNGRIETPITLLEHMTMQEVLRLCEVKGYDFQSFPVVSAEGKLRGLMTSNNFAFCEDPSVQVTEAMIPFEKLITGEEGLSVRQAYDLMRRHQLKVLPLIKPGGTLAQMYLLSDVKRTLSPATDHNIDQNGQLRVGAAVGVLDGAFERAELLARKKCDVFHVDTAHGDSKNVHETVRILKQRYPDIDVIAGNVSKGEAAKRLADVGADGVIVGQGPGSICTTRIVTGIGKPQVSAVYQCAAALEGSGVPVCADGGIDASGDMVLVLAVGAESVMLGRLLAGTDESPGDKVFHNGRWVKAYRGMGSLEAMRDNASSRERYGQKGSVSDKLVPEGVNGEVAYRGAVREALIQYTGGIRAGMAYHGAHTIVELQAVAEPFWHTRAGADEAHPHDVTITSQQPNYFGRS